MASPTADQVHVPSTTNKKEKSMATKPTTKAAKQYDADGDVDMSKAKKLAAPATPPAKKGAPTPPAGKKMGSMPPTKKGK